MQWTQSRRRFLATMSSAGAAGLISTPDALAQQAPETTTIRLARNPSLCIAPQYLVEEFLRMEGFTDVRYVMSDAAY